MDLSKISAFRIIINFNLKVYPKINSHVLKIELVLILSVWLFFLIIEGVWKKVPDKIRFYCVIPFDAKNRTNA